MDKFPTDNGCPQPTMKKMLFGEALTFMQAYKEGIKLTRKGWNGKGMFIQLQIPDEHSKMRRPYLYMSPVDGELIPWVASQTDILADDWIIVID